MKLLTKELLSKLAKLYSTEDTPLEEKIVACKFFTPDSSWTWYVLEGQEQADGNVIFFGWVVVFDNGKGTQCDNEKGTHPQAVPWRSA